MGMSTSDHTKAETKKTINSQFSTAHQNLVLQPKLNTAMQKYKILFLFFSMQYTQLNA